MLTSRGEQQYSSHSSDNIRGGSGRVDRRAAAAQLRMLANKIPELRAFAHEQNLGEVETAIIKCFAQALGEEEKSTLARYRQLRNKTFKHCDFRAARKTLGEFGITTPGGNARVIDVRGLSGARMVEKVKSHAGLSGRA